MTWDDIEMVNLRQTTDGSWSYTAYRKPFEMWRSNKGLPDVFACMEQIIGELAIATEVEEQAAKMVAKAVVTNAAAKGKASGGMKSRPAVNRGGKKTQGPTA